MKPITTGWREEVWLAASTFSPVPGAGLLLYQLPAASQRRGRTVSLGAQISAACQAVGPPAEKKSMTGSERAESST